MFSLNYFFDWDPQKAHKNISKHKISFERASKVFLDPYALTIFDEPHSIDEDRWITLGSCGTELIIVVIHTFNQLNSDDIQIRIISARKATKREIKQYQGKLS